MKLIGITGKKFSGKSTLAAMICEEYKAVELAFANPLKEICAKAFSVPLVFFHDAGLKEKTIAELGVSPRQMLQTIGMFFRDIKAVHLPELAIDNPWVYNVEKEIKYIRAQSEDVKIIVVSDVRFQDEYDMIKKNGGRIIRVVRRMLDSEENPHISETYMKNFISDITIENNDSLSDLRKNLSKISFSISS